jgi:hypothetical protein
MEWHDPTTGYQNTVSLTIRVSVTSIFACFGCDLRNEFLFEHDFSKVQGRKFASCLRFPAQQRGSDDIRPT